MAYISYLIYIVLLILGLCYNLKIIYFVFLFLAIEELCRNKKINSKYILVLALYSVILPDNYIPELFFILFFCLCICERRIVIRKSRYNVWLVCLTGIAIVSTLMNFVPLVNIFFSLVALMPFVVFSILVGNEKMNTKINLGKHIDKILYIESFATIINLLVNISNITDDWSSGTFGHSGGEQAQLFIVMTFLFIYYLSCAKEEGWCKRTLLKGCISGIILLSTNCWTLLAMFGLGLGLAWVIGLNKRRMLCLVVIIILLPILGIVMYEALPEKIITAVSRMGMDKNYFNYRFHKAQVYGETFIEIPRNDIKFLAFGNGLGYYNSRGALICTGRYVNFYNRLFEPGISKYTSEYIMDYLELAYTKGGSDYGSVLARPYASIMSIMGECGYLGVIFFFALISSLVKQKTDGAKVLIIIWLAFCCVESYFEYPKIIIVLYVCMFSLCQYTKKHDLDKVSMREK